MALPKLSKIEMRISATGGDLKRRIAAIMASGVPCRTGVAEHALVAAWLLAALTVPLVAGLGTAQAQRDAAGAPPVFEELSVRRAPGLRQLQLTDSAGTSRVSGLASLRDLIGLTDYADVASGEIVGGPEWLNTYGFEVAIAYKTSTGSRASAMRYVLEQRFKLAVHVETDPVYVLETMLTGPRFVEASRESVAAPSSQEAPGNIVLKGAPASNLAAALSRDLGHPVLDHTGLNARYDFDLRWSVARPLEPTDELDQHSAEVAYAAALDSALRSQLGLQLRSFPRQKLVVDHAELPVDD